MTIVRPLHARIWVVPLRIGLDILNAESHDVTKELADLILGELVLTRELQHLGQFRTLAVVHGQVFGSHI